MYNFARGHPNGDLVPLEEMQELFTKLGNGDSDTNLLKQSLNYGQGEGEPELLEELVTFMERHCKDDDMGGAKDLSNASSTKNLFITGGVSHGIELLCATQTKPGALVLVERPTYYLVSAILQFHHVQVKSLPMRDDGGVDLDRLEFMLEQGDIRPRMIYIIPTHQNPTGLTMPIQDRSKLAKLATRFGIVVAADEVYHLLEWRDLTRDGHRPARMAVLNPSESSEHSSKGYCVSVSSFTKIFSPGVRCGWIEGPVELIQSLINYGYIRSQGGCLPLMGEIMRNALIHNTVDQVLHKLVEAYQYRSQLLYDILRQEPRIIIPAQPVGGYFMWIQFPPKIVDVMDFLEFCRPELNFMPGVKCDALDAEQASKEFSLRLYARLCFADMDVAALETGANLLLSKFRAYMDQKTA